MDFWGTLQLPLQVTALIRSSLLLGCLDGMLGGLSPSSKELLVSAVACSVMENATFRHSRNPIAQNAQSEPTLNKVLQLLQSVERRLAQIESSLNLRITAVETSLEIAHEKIENLESQLASLETDLQLQATENRKAAIMHERRSKEFNLLFHGIPMNEKSESSNLLRLLRRLFVDLFLKNCALLPQISTESFSRMFIAFHGKRLSLLHLLLFPHHRLL